MLKIGFPSGCYLLFLVEVPLNLILSFCKLLDGNEQGNLANLLRTIQNKLFIAKPMYDMYIYPIS